MCGFISGWVAVGWIGFSAMLSSSLFSPELAHGRLPTSTSNCANDENSNASQTYITTAFNQVQMSTKELDGNKFVNFICILQETFLKNIILHSASVT